MQFRYMSRFLLILLQKRRILTLQTAPPERLRSLRLPSPGALCAALLSLYAASASG